MEEKKKFKYPFLTSELFHSQPSELVNYLLGIKEECGSSQSNDHEGGIQPKDDEDHDSDDGQNTNEETKDPEENKQEPEGTEQETETISEQTGEKKDDAEQQVQIDNFISSEETPE